ncbi:MAG: serine/threonine-protein kinase [Mariprofundaceae bacterium]
MERLSFVKNGWFIAMLLLAIFAGGKALHMPLFEQVEGMLYDSGQGFGHRIAGTTSDIAIIRLETKPSQEPDQRFSLRQKLADLLDAVASERPKAVALMLPLSSSQTVPGEAYFEEFQDLAKSGMGKKTAAKVRHISQQALQDLNADKKLVAAIKKTRSIFLVMEPGANSEDPVAEAKLIKVFRIRDVTRGNMGPSERLLANADDLSALQERPFRLPIPAFARKSSGVGHIEYVDLQDKPVRSIPLAILSGGQYFPSLALLVADRVITGKARHISMKTHRSITLGEQKIQTTPGMQLNIGYYLPQGVKSPFKSYLANDVLKAGRGSLGLRDKVVLIGLDGEQSYMTPVGRMDKLDLTGQAIASIIDHDYYKRPLSYVWIEMSMLLLIALYLAVSVPRMRVWPATLITLIMLFALISANQYLMIAQQSWLQTGAPFLLLLLGHIIFTARRIYSAQHMKHLADSAHTNRELGMAYQEQGMLDKAMGCYRNLPANDGNLDLIYNLAIDFERKRRFGKAVTAYDFILSRKAGFRDVKMRRDKADKLEWNVMLKGGSFDATSMLMDGIEHAPTLGRYEVEKELGKGAMGIVYLGRDPTIDRVVAIKTLALTQEFDEEGMKDASERFFHEAAAAGRLNHPNIVTIYDAGEEHDLSYIAMEYVDGKPLSDFCKLKKLLPIEKVLDIVARTADALGYAHDQDVVHRDIKPANLMYNTKSEKVMVTDFGIARITSNSRTKTGVILGTPSFMSPEQMTGQKVDGRSDLFSLGSSMFILLTGQRPFNGDSIAILSHQIINEKHPDICKIRPEIPVSVRNIIDKVLQKDPDKRYSSGVAMKRSIQRCLKGLQP